MVERPKYPERRRVRECILKALYEREINSESAPFLRLEEGFAALNISFKKRDFGVKYLIRLLNLVEELDELISEYLIDWTIERLNLIDKNLLRMGIFELIYEPDIPVEVTINELVELSKIYSDEEAPAFVNAVLDRVAKDHVAPQKLLL
ncbi:MAG: transcription antitermination factor NusB [Thermotogae bacterium]|nr:transcription antitermination factor NusB [Thermotogota bacterium]RKX42933.1 MAG: transcription antitermination factor NusB [Thermotogota bacterium]